MLLREQRVYISWARRLEIHCDVVVWESKSSATGNALGTNGVYLSPFGRFDVDLDMRVDFEHLGPRKSVHYGYTQNDTWNEHQKQ